MIRLATVLLDMHAPKADKFVLPTKRVVKLTPPKLKQEHLNGISYLFTATVKPDKNPVQHPISPQVNLTPTITSRSRECVPRNDQTTASVTTPKERSVHVLERANHLEAPNLPPLLAQNSFSRTVIITENDKNLRCIEDSIFSSNNLPFFQSQFSVTNAENKEPWELPLPTPDPAIDLEIVVLWNNPGYDIRGSNRFFSLVHYLLSRGYRVSAKIPSKANGEEQVSIHELSLIRKKWRSNIASMIRNRVPIPQEMEGKYRKSGSINIFLTLCQEEYNRKRSKIDSTQSEQKKEPISRRVEAAMRIFCNAFQVPKKNMWEEMTTNLAIQSMIFYYRDTRRLQLPLPPTVRYASLRHPDAKNWELHPTSVIGYGHDFHYRSAQYFDQGLLAVLHRYRCLIDFYFDLNGKKRVVESDDRLDKHRVIRFHDLEEALTIEYGENDRQVKQMRLGKTPIIRPNKEILVSVMTKIHRTFLDRFGAKVVTIEGKKKIRSKCMRGANRGFFLAHIEGLPKTIWIFEGPEEALTAKEALVRLKFVRKHFGSEMGNFAIIALPRLHSLHEINFPQCTKKIRIGLDNDGIQPALTRSLWESVNSYQKKYEVETVMAFTPILGLKMDFNDILTQSGLRELGKALCRNQPLKPTIFKYPQKPLQVPMMYEQAIEELKRNALQVAPLLQATKLALELDELEDARKHAEAAVFTAIGIEDDHRYVDALCMRAQVFMKQNKFNAALKTCEFAYGVHDSLLTAQEHWLLENMGDIYARQDKIDLAVLYYETILAGPALDLDKKATVLQKIGRARKEKSYFLESFRIRHQLQEQETVAKRQAIWGQISQEKIFYYSENQIRWVELLKDYTALFIEAESPIKAIHEYEKCIRKLEGIFKTKYSLEIADLYDRIGSLSYGSDPLLSLRAFQASIKIFIFLENAISEGQIEKMLCTIMDILKRVYPNEVEKQWLLVCENLGLKAETRKKHLPQQENI